MSRLRIGVLVALVALGVAVAIAIAVAPRWTPEQLRSEAEARLSAALDSEVEVGAVDLALGIGIHLEARDVRLWVGEQGPALVVETISIGIDPLSLLLGELRPRRMVLDGATLRIVENPDGRWSPPFEFLDPDPADPPRSTDEEILLVVNGLESALRAILERPLIADSLRARNSLVTLSLGGRPEGSADDAPVELRLELEDGRLRHSTLSGDAELELVGVLAGSQGPLGRVVWRTERDRHEVLNVEVSGDDLDLAAAQPWIRRLLPRAQWSGRIGGTASASWPKPGVSRIELDLAATGFQARAPEGEDALGELSAPEVDLQVDLGVEDAQVEIDTLRVGSGSFEISLEGAISRPLDPASEAQLSLRAREVDLTGLRALIEWTSPETRETLLGPTAGVLSGRLARFDLEGSGALRSWGQFLQGDLGPAALQLVGGIEASEVSVALGDQDRLDRLAIEARLSGDRLDVIEARADLAGAPLPALHLKIDGVSHWFDADPSLRRISSGALSLSGLPLLWQLATEDERDAPDSERFQASVALDIETLQYPLFVWPLEDVHAVVESGQRGLNVLLTRGTWGGVPIEGSASWVFEPSREVFVQVTAGVPRSLAQLPPPRHAWARGRFVVHPVKSSVWHGLSASGRFSADAGTVRFHEVAVDLEPAGTIRTSGSLDLSSEDRVPFQVSAELNGGDIADLSQQLDIMAGQASGNLSAWGTFDGALSRDHSALADLSGALEIRADEGAIWQKLPAVLAITLASEAFNPFAERETIRYESVETHLDVDAGRMHTDSFTLDGPDLRVFADGDLDLANAPHEIDAELALFMFRQLDSAIDLIPVLNVLLLGPDENLLAAHFALSGPWDDPTAKLVPMRSLSSGPASLVVEGIPNIMRKGFNALGTIFQKDDDEGKAPGSEPNPFPWES